MDNLIIIYEADSCCSGGSCCSGTADTSCSDFEEALTVIKRLGNNVVRYNMAKDLLKFRENRDVIKLIHDHQLKALPITVVNGEIIKTGSYPSFKDLTSILQ